MANATWLEAALNGGWGRHYQPGIPLAVADIIAEGVACAREGAATRSNLEWVQAAGAAILAAGSSPATPAEVRRALNGS